MYTFGLNMAHKHGPWFTFLVSHFVYIPTPPINLFVGGPWKRPWTLNNHIFVILSWKAQAASWTFLYNQVFKFSGQMRKLLIQSIDEFEAKPVYISLHKFHIHCTLRFNILTFYPVNNDADILKLRLLPSFFFSRTINF